MKENYIKNNKIKTIVQIILFILLLVLFLIIYNILTYSSNKELNSNGKLEEDESMVLNITKENYNDEVLNSNIPVIIDFYADWCGPCKMMSPVIDEIAEEYKGIIKVGKVNIDKEETLATDFGVMSIPTIVIIKNGKISKTFVGVQSKEAIISEIKE